jgi:hypothetical protein
MLRMLGKIPAVIPRVIFRNYRTLQSYQIPPYSARFIEKNGPQEIADKILRPIEALPPKKSNGLRIFQSSEFGLNGYPAFVIGADGEHPVETQSADGSVPIKASDFLKIAERLAERFRTMEPGNALCISAGIKFNEKLAGENTESKPLACVAAFFLTSGPKQVFYIQPKQCHSHVDGFSERDVQIRNNSPIQLITIPDPNDREEDRTAKILQCLDLTKATAPSSDITLYPASGGPIGFGAIPKRANIIVATEAVLRNKSGIWMRDPEDNVKGIFEGPSNFLGKAYDFIGETVRGFFDPDPNDKSKWGRYTNVTGAYPDGPMVYLGEITLPTPQEKYPTERLSPPRTFAEAADRAFGEELSMQMQVGKNATASGKKPKGRN